MSAHQNSTSDAFAIDFSLLCSRADVASYTSKHVINVPLLTFKNPFTFVVSRFYDAYSFQIM
jgi:hypothetical protein